MPRWPVAERCVAAIRWLSTFVPVRVNTILFFKVCFMATFIKENNWGWVTGSVAYAPIIKAGKDGTGRHWAREIAESLTSTSAGSRKKEGTTWPGLSF